MAEIDSRLIDFKSSIGSSTASMKSMCTTICDKLTVMSTATQNTKSSLNSIYDSVNKNTTLNRLDRLSTIASEIIASVNSDLTGMIDAADNVVTLVGELETLKKQIDSKNGIANSETATDEEKASASGEASRLNGEFNNKHNVALEKYLALLGMDSNIAFVEKYSPDNSKIDFDNVQYGSVELNNDFVASNGIAIEYYMYIPDYGNGPVDNAPLFCYMHGGGPNAALTAAAAARYGLTNHIINQKVTPGCYVCMPVVKNFSPEGYKALNELFHYCAKKYNTDPDKMGIGGHSYGGLAATAIVNANPGEYSCCIALSGSNIPTESFAGTKTWFFTGEFETKDATGTPRSKKAAEMINSMGGEALLTVLPRGGHEDTNREVFLNEYTSPDGETINPLDWFVKQTRA